MSWFDTAGLANLAKTALKEAQKQIDKALDIKDEVDTTSSIIAKQQLQLASDDKNDSKLSKTEPTTPAEKMKQSNSSPANLNSASSVWGSFTGSFFENASVEKQLTVTTPPSSSTRKIETLSESESLEILSNPTTPGSSITSPGGQISSVSTILGGSESVEVLGIDTPTSEIVTTDESSSIIASNINSPSSVEVISEDFASPKDDVKLPDFDDDEDDSISYNTVSDTVTAVTVVEPNMLSSNSPATTIITTPPSRTSLHLSLGGSFNISNMSDESNESDRTLNNELAANTKSETESQTTSVMLEEAMIDKLSDISTQLSDSTQSFEDIHNSSTNLLTISYQNQSTTNLERSSDRPDHAALNISPPLSVDSKNSSDLVKISSSQTSGHTSGDEIETATSSDIEIISSPNGDSSSTHSACRISPKTGSSSSACAKSRGFEILSGSSASESMMKLSKKGHSRELSEISIKSDDSSQTENDKLSRRIIELQELLEAREFKLLELGRHNAELQEKYTEIMEKIQPNLELTNVTEEYTQRLSALEKKFQQSIRERDHLRKQLDSTKLELNSRVDKEYFDTVVKEKEQIAVELRHEGEKLSKQVLQHSNIIKKLRAKEKENEATLKKQKEQIEELTDEMERLKKSLFAKDEVERSQIEAVHKLSSEKRKLEKENYQMTSQLDDLQQKMETVQKSFDAAKKELTDKKQAHSELSKKTEAIQSLESDYKMSQSRNEQYEQQISELREKLKHSDTESSLREHKLRIENGDLLRRLEEAELRAEENAQAVTLSTIPLVKQLEALQTTLNARTATWDKREKVLLDKYEEAQRRLTNLSDFEQVSKQQASHLNTTILNLEERLSSALLKSEQSISLLQHKELEFELMQRDLRKEIDTLNSQRNDNEHLIESLQSRVSLLEDQLKKEKENSTRIERHRSEKKMSTSFNLVAPSSLMDPDEEVETIIEGANKDKRESMGSSPTHSLAKLSFCESQGSNVWPLEDFDYIPTNRPSGPESIYGANSMATIGHAPYLESLQSTLKQRDGELHQLQWELSRLQTERTFLTQEISNLTSELDQIKEKFEKNQHINEQFVELQQKHDAVLQMYGEKVEETQELVLDLQDVKEMYRAQIDELLRQQKQYIQNSSDKV